MDNGEYLSLDCFASLAMTGGTVVIARSSDEAIQTGKALHWVARFARNDGRGFLLSSLRTRRAKQSRRDRDYEQR
ncbi:MAG: hypothetical protein LBT00_05515 [Spirochaetaceae bacterium]|nr:hypothetical protein [Spirochaetaceae bacterium]